MNKVEKFHLENHLLFSFFSKKYQLTSPRKGYEKNFEVAQELMSSFEYSGVFG